MDLAHFLPSSRHVRHAGSGGDDQTVGVVLADTSTTSGLCTVDESDLVDTDTIDCGMVPVHWFSDVPYEHWDAVRPLAPREVHATRTRRPAR